MRTHVRRKENTNYRVIDYELLRNLITFAAEQKL